jgi:hypothetical protein
LQAAAGPLENGDVVLRLGRPIVVDGINGEGLIDGPQPVGHQEAVLEMPRVHVEHAELILNPACDLRPERAGSELFVGEDCEGLVAGVVQDTKSDDEVPLARQGFHWKGIGGIRPQDFRIEAPGVDEDAPVGGPGGAILIAGGPEGR